jgi:hypothetical protein
MKAYQEVKSIKHISSKYDRKSGSEDIVQSILNLHTRWRLSSQLHAPAALTPSTNGTVGWTFQRRKTSADPDRNQTLIPQLSSPQSGHSD